MPVTSYISVNGRMISEITDGVILDYVPDALGSIHSVIDQDANVVKTMRYKPYGEVLSRSGTVADRHYQWVGSYGYRATFAPSSSHYVRARHYTATAGSWSTVDPLWPGESAYGYVKGRVSRGIDPSGLACATPDCNSTPADKKKCADNCKRKGYNLFQYNCPTYTQWVFVCFRAIRITVCAEMCICYNIGKCGPQIAAKQLACQQSFGCNGKDGCADAIVKLNLGLACYAARLAVDKCLDPTGKTHDPTNKEVMNAINNCADIVGRKCK
jgi:RHS repeat-associated protein